MSQIWGWSVHSWESGDLHQRLFKTFGRRQGGLGVCHVLFIAVGAGGRNGLPFLFCRLITAFNVLFCCFRAHRERRSQKGGKVIIKVAEQAAVDASVLVVGSFCAIRVHRAAVIIAKVAIVD